MPRVHELKCWPGPFEAVRDGRKTYEVRVNDRDYHVGDELLLREWEPERATLSASEDGRARYTGRALTRHVSYITHGGEFGLPLNLCVLGLSVYPVSEGTPRNRVVLMSSPRSGKNATLDAAEKALRDAGHEVHRVSVADVHEPPPAVLKAALLALGTERPVGGPVKPPRVGTGEPHWPEPARCEEPTYESLSGKLVPCGLRLPCPAHADESRRSGS